MFFFANGKTTCYDKTDMSTLSFGLTVWCSSDGKDRKKPINIHVVVQLHILLDLFKKTKDYKVLFRLPSSHRAVFL